MEVEVETDLLRRAADGARIDCEIWPEMRRDILARLDRIVHDQFPIPTLPPAPDDAAPSLPLQPVSSPAPADGPDGADDAPSAANPPPSAPPALPPALAAMVDEIATTLACFGDRDGPPHTIQRLAELLLAPQRNYRSLAAFLHAVDRVVHVTSPAARYPLAAAARANGGPHAVSWGTPAVAVAVGSDEALGGALLTAVPWVARRAAAAAAAAAVVAAEGDAAATATPRLMRVEIRSESTETIVGPNGVGSVETVTVRVNGPSSTAADANGPVDDDSTPHVRGPVEIGVQDLGPQPADVVARVGAPHPATADADADAAAEPEDDDTAMPDANADADVDAVVLKLRDGEHGVDTSEGEPG